MDTLNKVFPQLLEDSSWKEFLQILSNHIKTPVALSSGVCSSFKCNGSDVPSMLRYKSAYSLLEFYEGLHLLLKTPLLFSESQDDNKYYHHLDRFLDIEYLAPTVETTVKYDILQDRLKSTNFVVDDNKVYIPNYITIIQDIASTETSYKGFFEDKIECEYRSSDKTYSYTEYNILSVCNNVVTISGIIDTSKLNNIRIVRHFYRYQPKLYVTSIKSLSDKALLSQLSISVLETLPDIAKWWLRFTRTDKIKSLLDFWYRLRNYIFYNNVYSECFFEFMTNVTILSVSAQITEQRKGLNSNYSSYDLSQISYQSLSNNIKVLFTVDDLSNADKRIIKVLYNTDIGQLENTLYQIVSEPIIYNPEVTLNYFSGNSTPDFIKINADYHLDTTSDETCDAVISHVNDSATICTNLLTQTNIESTVDLDFKELDIKNEDIKDLTVNYNSFNLETCFSTFVDSSTSSYVGTAMYYASDESNKSYNITIYSDPFLLNFSDRVIKFNLYRKYSSDDKNQHYYKYSINYKSPYSLTINKNGIVINTGTSTLKKYKDTDIRITPEYGLYEDFLLQAFTHPYTLLQSDGSHDVSDFYATEYSDSVDIKPSKRGKAFKSENQGAVDKHFKFKSDKGLAKTLLLWTVKFPSLDDSIKIESAKKLFTFSSKGSAFVELSGNVSPNKVYYVGNICDVTDSDESNSGFVEFNLNALKSLNNSSSIKNLLSNPDGTNAFRLGYLDMFSVFNTQQTDYSYPIMDVNNYTDDEIETLKNQTTQLTIPLEVSNDSSTFDVELALNLCVLYSSTDNVLTTIFSAPYKCSVSLNS